MPEHPLTVDAREAKGLHDGTITRIVRVMEPQPLIRHGRFHLWMEGYDSPVLGEPEGEFRVRAKRICPLGVPGDRLWLQEPWGVGTRPCPNRGWYDGIEYAFEQSTLDDGDILPCREVDVPDGVDLDDFKGQWNSAAEMPRWASSLLLEVKDVKVVRVQEVTSEDAYALGFRCECIAPIPRCGGNILALMDGIGPDTWDANKWVWLGTVAKVEA